MSDTLMKRIVPLMLVALVVAVMVVPAGAAPGRPTVSGRAPAQHGATPATPLVVLWDQNNNQGVSSIVSQNFETALDAYDSQGADNFSIPANTDWGIQQVVVSGVYFNGPGPGNSFNVCFYTDNGGLPNNTAVACKNNQGFTASGSTFTINLTPPVKIPRSAPDNLWISVQQNLDFTPGGEWGWTDRTVANGAPAAWRNPPDGFGTGCSNWSNMNACIGVNDPDFAFALLGLSRP